MAKALAKSSAEVIHPDVIHPFELGLCSDLPSELRVKREKQAPGATGGQHVDVLPRARVLKSQVRAHL